jgi:hypothetical protein
MDIGTRRSGWHGCVIVTLSRAMGNAGSAI